MQDWNPFTSPKKTGICRIHSMFKSVEYSEKQQTFISVLVRIQGLIRDSLSNHGKLRQVHND